MDWTDVAKNFGPLGLVMAALVVLARDALKRNETMRMQQLADQKEIRLREIQVEDKKADGLVAALGALGGKIDSHHTTDIQSHQELAAGIAGLHSKVDEHLSFKRALDEVTGQHEIPIPVTVDDQELQFEQPRPLAKVRTQTPMGGYHVQKRPGTKGGG